MSYPRPIVPLSDRISRRAPVLLGLGLFGALVLPRLVEASVAEQRARLPPAAECPDAITGTWKALSFRPRWNDWNDWTLKVSRDKADPQKLKGFILNHSWDGGSKDSVPPPCDGGRELTISMDAEGQVQGDLIEFWGVGDWRLDAAHCGELNGGYNLDHFSGEIDHSLHEFQSVNNDGGTAVNEPTVFRRVRCEEQPDLPTLNVSPPPYYPPDSGCLGR